ncbi:MAG: penicillin-binding transpeptidase domain-containing protein [Phycisphaerae bacterium]
MNTLSLALISCLLVQASPHAPQTATSQPAAKSSPMESTIDLKEHFGEFDGCFVMIDSASGATRRYNAKRCTERFSPCSTFKVPHALIALELGVLTGADHVLKWDKVEHWNKPCNADLDLREAMRASCLWYFQRVAPQIGREHMRDWLDKLDYGNADCSGEFTEFWINGTIQISAEEQAAFMNRLRAGDLPFSRKSMETVREMIQARKTDDVVIYGKTGTRGDANGNFDLGWFVGWVETKQRTFAFATNIEAAKGAMGPKAREITFAIVDAILAEK